jgi:transposase InsO family protein
VKLHRNAKTTPVTRALLVRRIRQQGWLVRDAAAAQSVSVQTAYKWLRRNRDGDRHCEDRSSTPHCQPRRTAPALVAGIVGLRQQRLTAWQIAVRVQVPRSTVAVILARAGRNRLRLLMPPAPVVRYERRRPGELVHVDMKRRGRIARIGHRIHGDRRYRGRGIGWETVPVCVDDHSRAAYVEVLADQQAGTTTAFITRAVRWFARRGVRVERIMTDNGSAYRSPRFRRCCERFGARHLRTRAYRPQTNGKAERFIQTLLREWAYAIPYSSSWRRTCAVCPWLRYYNGQRPHTSLSYQSPASRFPRAVQ